ncbi:hypothetical protein SESBI_09458 [Sesbania bispinosa]|nr:hypothetical protein SESBI_09458 [Sesbania bispinosa]
MDSTSKVQLRNACELKFLTKVNNELTTVQRDRIEGTPFGWTVELPVDIQICGPFLLELALRWCERCGGFRISSAIVPFTPLDVYVVLGLRIVGEKSISRVYDILRDGQNSSQLHIVGCVPILQLWAMYHLSMCPRGISSTVNSFPKIKSWQNFHQGSKGIEALFKTNLVAFEVSVTNKELKEFLVLKEAMDEAQCDFCNFQFLSLDWDNIRRENVALRENNKKLEDRICHLESPKSWSGWQHQVVRHVIYTGGLCRLLRHPIRICCENCMCTARTIIGKNMTMTTETKEVQECGFAWKVGGEALTRLYTIQQGDAMPSGALGTV